MVTVKLSKSIYDASSNEMVALACERLWYLYFNRIIFYKIVPQNSSDLGNWEGQRESS